jgi:Fe-S cluster assembly protein SufD
MANQWCPGGQLTAGINPSVENSVIPTCEQVGAYTDDETMNIETTIETTAAFREQREGETAWLYDLRKQAWDAYVSVAMPDRVKHLWRYTDPLAFVPNVDRDLKSAVGNARADLTSEAEGAGVILMGLVSAAQKHPDLVKKHVATLIGPAFDKFEALNLATTEHGLFLYVPDNVTLEQPLLLNRTVESGVFPARLLIIVGENAEVTIIDEYTGFPGQSGQINSVVELFAEDAARVKYVTRVDLQDTQSLFLTQRNRVGRDADMQSVGLSFNAGLAKINWATELAGQGANSRWSGLLLGDQEQHFDTHTSHHHTAGESFSDLLYKVALRDKSRAVYTGLIAIDEDAANCEAYQENRNLLLSEDAHVESIPELEIVNDDVKCSHGVTVGPLEEEQLFYFESRGIDRDEAMRIILAGYYEAVLERVPQSYRETARTNLLTKLMGERQNGGELH